METAMCDRNFVIAVMLMAVLASAAPAVAQTQTQPSSDCLGISVDTENVLRSSMPRSASARVCLDATT